MRCLLAIGLTMMAHGAMAQDVLTDLAGSWAGSGTFLDRNIEEDIRCRINVTSDGNTTNIAGVCASARRNENVDLRIIRNDDGTLTAQQENENSLRRPLVLDGVLGEDSIALSGRRGAEETRLTLQLIEPDTLAMTSITSSASRTQSTTLQFARR